MNREKGSVCDGSLEDESLLCSVQVQKQMYFGISKKKL